MMIRRTRLSGSLLIALGAMSLSACAPQPEMPATETATEALAAAPVHPDQATIDDLVLANRIIATELGILDVQGHVTARSRVNPDHYFIARFVAPGGATTSDMIENDLESNAVDGPRNDQARETHLHGQIYKARPDVMAIVHSHTPEFVAYSMSSVPLWSGENRIPVFDIRPFNKGRNGIISTPELGQIMAKTLGSSEGVLLWGHGIALTSGSSLPDLVSRVEALRTTAQVQQAVIARGGSWDPQAKQVVLQADPAETPTADGMSGTAKTWEHLKRLSLGRTGGTVPNAAMPAPPPLTGDAAIARDVAYANRILASDRVGVLDGFGHVSLRNPLDANRYFMAAKVAPAAVKPGDVVQRDMTQPRAVGQGYSIHDEVYKARPDVKAILYARTPEIVAFTQGAERLRPVVNGGAFIGDGFPTFDLGSLDPAQPILTNPAFGSGVAEALGNEEAVYLSGHGFVLVSTTSIYRLTDRAYALRHNALIQQQATALRGTVEYFDDRPVAPAPVPAAPAPAPAGPTLGPPEGRGWIYWRDMTSLD